MPPGPLDLHLLCEDLLDACMEALDAIPTFAATLDGAPDRAFVTFPGPVAGHPALDCCPQLTVHAGPLSESPTPPLGLGAGTRHKQDARINLVTLVATSVRCVPVGSDTAPPSVQESEQAAEQLNADGWALWNHIWEMIRADRLFAICQEVFWDGLRPLAPSGGCAGWVLVLRVQLNGYDDVAGT